MLISSLLLALNTLTGSQVSDTARRVADTVFIEPVGVRLIIPPLWMGTIPAGEGAHSSGLGAFNCQLRISGPVDDRVVLDPSRFAATRQGLYGARRSYQNALDAILSNAMMVAHVGGDRFNSGCVAPHAQLYVAGAEDAAPAGFGAQAERVIALEYGGIKRVETDSASWHIVRISWTEAKTDWIHPATLEIWSQRIGNRFFVIAVMDSWANRVDSARLLASIRHP
jgi:hypothetical protein